MNSQSNKQKKLNVKKDFPWFRNNHGIYYFDNSATTLKPKCVINETVFYYENWSSNPHNSDSIFTYRLGEKIEKVRKQLATTFSCLENEIIFTSGATESLDLFAYGLKKTLKKGDEIVLTYMEHSSNSVPWLKLKQELGINLIFAGKKNKIPTELDIIKAVTNRTKIVSFCNVSNLLGYELNVAKTTKGIKKINSNVIVVVDATQAVPHGPINVKKSGIDLLACSAHKMCGPTGIGCAYISEKLHNTLEPLRLGGGMNNELDEEHFTYSSAPSKYEGGTPNVAGIIGWGAALTYLENIGWKKINEHSIDLKKFADDEMKKIPNIIYYSNGTKYPVISFNIKNVHAQDLANYLWQNKIIVRSGVSCAKNSKNVTNSDAVVRASFYLYNNIEDIKYLVNTLRKFRKGSELDGVI